MVISWAVTLPGVWPWPLDDLETAEAQWCSADG